MNQQSDYYKSSSAFLDGRVVHHIFSTDDERQHMMEKRPIAKFYSPTGVLAIEPQVDKTILQFLDELDRRFAVEGAEGFGKPFDLGEWVSYCLFPFFFLSLQLTRPLPPITFSYHKLTFYWQTPGTPSEPRPSPNRLAISVSVAISTAPSSTRTVPSTISPG